MAIFQDTLAERVSTSNLRQCRIVFRVQPEGMKGSSPGLSPAARKSAPEGACKWLLLSGESMQQPEEAVFSLPGYQFFMIFRV